MDRQHGTFLAAASVTGTLRHEGDGNIDQLVTALDFYREALNSFQQQHPRCGELTSLTCPFKVNVNEN